MAGIGFELNKLFKEKGLAAKVRAYGYSCFIVSGPLLLGILFILIISNIAKRQGLILIEQYLLMAMVTYAIMAALFVNGLISLPLTRFVSDKLYLSQDRKVVPSFFGAIQLVLPLGSIIYFIFLLKSKLGPMNTFTNILLFGELVCIFFSTNYLTAVKDYKGIVLSYVLAIVSSVLALLILTRIFGPKLYIYILSIDIGYGVQLFTAIMIIFDYFDTDGYSEFSFLPWLKKYWSLMVIGTMQNIGVFSHIVITWRSKIGIHIKGEFFSAPLYDVPSLYAYLATLVTTVYFVTKAETDFYDKYSLYFNCLNSKASVKDVEEARRDMLTIMWSDIIHTAMLQLLTTVAMLSVGLELFEMFQGGFTLEMRYYFIILSIAYGLYATANMLTLYSMYFADYKSVLIDTIIFALSTTWLTIISEIFLDPSYYGFGFAIGSLVYLIISFLLLQKYTANLNYEVLVLKPFIVKEEVKKNPFSLIIHRMSINSIRRRKKITRK